jgi:putative acetyltransferase
VAKDEIGVEDPRREDVRELLSHHLAHARSNSLPEEVHALEVDGLVDPTVTLFGFRRDGKLLAVGALRQLADGHAELKSMHTAEAVRGTGIGRTMVDHLVGVARGRGLRQVSIETGTQGAFVPARSLYERAGFSPCGPFGDYRPSPNSAFMTLAIEPDSLSGSA